MYFKPIHEHMMHFVNPFEGRTQMSVETGPAIDHTRLAVYGKFLQTLNYDADPKTSYVILTDTMDLFYYEEWLKIRETLVEAIVTPIMYTIVYFIIYSR